MYRTQADASGIWASAATNKQTFCTLIAAELLASADIRVVTSDRRTFNVEIQT
jgi:hypothetical protein